jgi:hypothetical protein
MSSIILQQKKVWLKITQSGNICFASIGSWLSSEVSQKQWCHDQGIAYHVFHYWYRKYRDEHPASTNDNSFVRLTVKPEGVCCEVIFTDGTKIIFREAVPAQYLKSLLF